MNRVNFAHDLALEAMTPEPHPTAREALNRILPRFKHVPLTADAILAALEPEGWTLQHRSTFDAIGKVAAAERERIAAPYIEALEDLLEDTQHSEHHCGDPECPVAAARKLVESRDAGGAEK